MLFKHWIVLVAKRIGYVCKANKTALEKWQTEKKANRLWKELLKTIFCLLIKVDMNGESDIWSHR